MTGRSAATPWVRRWGSVLTGVSIIGTVLTVLAVLGLSLVVYGFASEFGGSPPPWWYWPVWLGFAAAGIAGLSITVGVPLLPYLLRLVCLSPVLAVGLASPWLMLPVVVVAAADVSLMLSHWAWPRRVGYRVLAGAAMAVLLATFVLPLDKELSCENLGDPPETCDVWYLNVLGWGYYEEDNRDLAGWILVALLGGLLVALPVARDEQDALV